MTTAVCYEHHRFMLGKIALPKVQNELHQLTWIQWSWLPKSCKSGQIGGHEGVGTIAAIGPGVDKRSNLKTGDRKYVLQS